MEIVIDGSGIGFPLVDSLRAETAVASSQGMISTYAQLALSLVSADLLLGEIKLKSQRR